MNLAETLLNIERRCAQAEKPAIMSSFGKESLCVIALCRILKFNFPVIYHRNPWFPHKNDFADRIAKEWNLEVHDWHPFQVGVKTHYDCIQPVARYRHGKNSSVSIPIGTLPPVDGEPYLCGLADIIGREKGTDTFESDLLIFGHKACDKDIFEGKFELKTDFVSPLVGGAPAILYPIRDWTDADVWKFIFDQRIPFQEERYDPATQKEFEDKTYNNDYVRTCMKCIDRREEDIVFCPKLQREIPNVSHTIADLEEKLEHVEYA